MLVAALVASLLVACGGDGDSSSSTAAPVQEPSRGEESASSKGDGDNGGEAPSGGSENGPKDSGGSGQGSSAAFVPKRHEDSGGGAEQFHVKGGDNSIQEFGEEAEGSQLEAAAATLHNYLDARAEGNWTAACEYMSKTTVESLEKLSAQARQVGDRSCGGILEKLTNPAASQAIEAEAASADVGSLRIEGERAFVIYTGVEDAILAMPMTNEGGEWKVAGLVGTSLD